MDIASRKYRFIEEFMRIINSEKMDRLQVLEDILYADDSINEENSPLTEDQIQVLDEIRLRHISGKSPSMSLDELREKFKDTYGVQH